ncbi:centromere protein X isoform X1 [Alexandromys fortis]|uniref:centromere protein X isoform X1 n=1 Tax=Alexandromys fortis TaxID=100897 RepID=UPI002152D2F1|nr:centromere protein X isoform X1 [Microtus fortis]
MEEMSGFPKVRPTGVRGAGEQSTAPALQGLQDESQWGRVAAHGGVLEDLRGSRCSWGAAGPGRGPRHRGCGSAGEGAPSAAPGLLEVGLWPAESRTKSCQHRHPVPQVPENGRTPGAVTLPSYGLWGSV